MASRRQIREAVVQFLYCADLEGGGEPTNLREPFWDFVTESDRRALQVATLRTVVHLAQGREARLDEFHARLEAARSLLAAWPEAETLKSALERLGDLEIRWSAAFANLQRQPLDEADKARLADQLGSGLGTLFVLDREVAETRRRFLEGLDDFPALRPRLEAVAASLRRLQRVSDRIRMVENPEQFPEQGDLAKLRESKASLQILRQRTDQLVDALLAHKAGIDEALAGVVDNYTPERIDPVDRAVLRLATYELAHTDTPVKVVINEAIELARRFGTTDSHRFVNGLLDPLAKRLRP